jgi:tetratricopeptide (TPR) repeat protein
MQRPDGTKTTAPPEHGPAWQNRALEWFNRYRRHLLIAAAGLLLLLLVTQSYRSKARTERTESWRALSEVRAIPLPPDAVDPEEAHARLVVDACRRILNERWETDATPWAILEMAVAQNKAGDRQGALASYRRLREEYEGHFAALFAAAGHAAALDDDGRIEEAVATYEELASARGDDSLFWLDVGRCLELAGDREGAMGAYERIARAEPEEGAEGASARAAWRLNRLKAGTGPLLDPVPPAPETPVPAADVGPITDAGGMTDTDIVADSAITTDPGTGEPAPGESGAPVLETAPSEGEPPEDAGEAETAH